MNQKNLYKRIGWEPIQVAQNAEKAVNGTGNLNWVQILETSYRLYCSGQQLEKYGKKMQQGQEPDIIKLKTIFNQFNTGKSNRMPLSQITGDEIPFIETGWQVIDDHLGGLPIVGLIVVAGNPGCW